MIDLEFLERLIRTLDESGLDHVEIEREGARVRVSRSPPLVLGTSPRESAEEIESATSPDPADLADAPHPEGEPGEEVDAGWVEISSPMVGTFYRAPSPEADAFVEVGSEISPGDVLCIIEAMKLMNELPAEIGGTVQQISVRDGEPVEYGQALFRVQPS